jgi:DNA-binding CsgD family transcriptional regulator
VVDAIDELGRGRESYARRAWMDAYKSLSRADQAAALGAEDLELLATSAYMLGRDDEYLSCLERAHHAYLDGGEAMRAVRCAFWVGVNLALRGEMGRATGWLGRAQRLLERQERDCVERGNLLLPVVLQHVVTGDWEAAYAAAADAAEIGERFGDRDLFALAVHEQGRALVRQGQVEEGLGLLDEAMVAVTADELSPIVTGLTYCSVIDICQEVYALHRAQEWTAALTQWCEQQPDIVAITGRCLLHRAEIMQLHGAWREALEEARRARQRCEQGKNQSATARAFYQQAEVHRLQGRFNAAEEAYRDASRWGWEPQPGLALLRLAEGDARAALLALRHAWQVWQELKAPYEAARTRVLLGLACRSLGDDDTAALELEAAHGVFAQLGAAPDLARVDSLTRRAASVDDHGLTARELQVLRLVAAGETNKAIAAELVLSERTVDRHVSNIFTKLGVSSRTAATAYAYKHQLV